MKTKYLIAGAVVAAVVVAVAIHQAKPKAKLYLF